MLIRDLEQKTGLDRATIRFYEKEGMIFPARAENGYRSYSEEERSTLMKIKLLRQLGMTLDQIKSLQSGEGDLQTALNEQIRILENRIGSLNQAKDTCIRMRGDQVRYDTLDAERYLNQLSSPAKPAIKREFREPIKREYHPVRRWLARILDYELMIVLLQFLLIVVLRIRPYGDWLTYLVTYGTVFLMIPVQALMLHFWGTTPGKWCMGLRVESENGGLLTFEAAKNREWEAVSRGYGFGLPGWSLWRMYKSYLDYQQNDPDWDWQSEYIYKTWELRRKAALAGVILILAGMVGFSSGDVVLPKYRGDLTLAEFTKNYNFYVRLSEQDLDQTELLQRNGKPYPVPEGVAVIDFGGKSIKAHNEFQYELEGEKLKKIRYENTWTEIGWLSPITAGCSNAVITAVMSQDGMNVKKLTEFEEIISTEMEKPSGRVSYENVEIVWNVETENCKKFNTGGIYAADDENLPSSISVEFEITIR